MSSPAPGTYRILPDRSTVTFTVKHLFGLGTVHGTFGVAEGMITIAEPVGQSRAQGLISAGSFATGNARRDREVLSAKYLDSAAYPDIRFDGTSVSAAGTGWTVTGTLTAKGVTRPLELHVDRASTDAGHTSFHATTEVDRYQFEITAGKGMAGQRLSLDLTVVASLE